MLQKLLLTGKRISLRTPTRDDLPILYNLIYGVENPEWKKYDAPYYPLEFCTFEKFSNSHFAPSRRKSGGFFRSDVE